MSFKTRAWSRRQRPGQPSLRWATTKKAVKSDDVAIEVSIWNDQLANNRKEGVTQEVWKRSQKESH
eukprot:2560269-Ditylum_brightwellii.AAC.1